MFPSVPLRALVILAFCSVAHAGVSHAANVAAIEKAYEEGDDAAVRSLVTRARAEAPDDAAVIYWSGRVAMMDEDWDAAMKLFDEARELEPANGAYHLWAGRAQAEKIQTVNLLARRGYASSIIECFRTAVEADPDDPEARGALAQYYLQAPGFVGGDVTRGLAEIEVMRSLDPATAASSLGWYYNSKKKYDEAAHEFERGLRDAPDDPRAHYNHALYCQSRERWDAAFSGFEKARAMTAGATGPLERNLNARALYQLGRTCAFSGERPDDGIAWMEEYLQRNVTARQPSKADAYARLGMIYEHKRDQESARTCYRKALALEPDHENAKSALDRID